MRKLTLRELLVKTTRRRRRLLPALLFYGTFLLVFGVNWPSLAKASTLSFKVEPPALVAGQTALWTLAIRQNDGLPVRDFTLTHEKLLHLVVVSKDLSWFNHLHPVYKGNGVFTIAAALPRAGRYKLYADFTPVGKAQEIAQQELTVGSSTAPPATPLVAEKMRNVWLHRSVVAVPEGQPDAAGGETYHVEMMPVPLRAGQDVKLHFQVNDADFQPVTTLEPYLGTLGHLVVISAKTGAYLHSHALQGSSSVLGANLTEDFNSSGPDVVFHVKFPSGGLYKVWAEFKHHGAIITAPFVFNVDAAPDGAKPMVADLKNSPRGKKPVVAAPSKSVARGLKSLPSDLAFRDLKGRVWRLADWRGEIPVFVFVDSTCPCVGAYDERIKQLQAQYQSRGLRLIYVFSSLNDTLAKVQGAVSKRKYAWPVVYDGDQKLLRMLNAHCTTEAFLFDRQGGLQYHGRIDDSTFAPSAVRSRDLEMALQSVIAGRRVARRETRVWACELARR